MTSSYRPLKGRFLVSEPFMSDANFQRTVVLLVEHNVEGSLGFVLNRQLNVSLPEMVGELPIPGAKVFLGGPVENTTLHYVHRRADLPESRSVAEGVYWSGNYELLQEWARLGTLDPSEILFFVGYSGWGPGQLDSELDRKSWIVAPENGALVFDNEPDNLWRSVLHSLGDRFRIISNYPSDPSLN